MPEKFRGDAPKEYEHRQKEKCFGIWRNLRKDIIDAGCRFSYEDMSTADQLKKTAATPEYLDRLLQKKKGYIIKIAVAYHPNTSPETLRKLADDKYASTRGNVAKNPNTPSDALSALSRDMRSIRILLLENPNTPPEDKTTIAKLEEERKNDKKLQAALKVADAHSKFLLAHQWGYVRGEHRAAAEIEEKKWDEYKAEFGEDAYYALRWYIHELNGHEGRFINNAEAGSMNHIEKDFREYLKEMEEK